MTEADTDAIDTRMMEAEVKLPTDIEEVLAVSRRRLSVFLSQYNAYDLLPDSGKVVALDANLHVEQAFHILHEQGISSAPLWDFDAGVFVGIVTAVDFMKILREVAKHGNNVSNEERETQSIAAWKERISLCSRNSGGNGKSTRHFVYAGPFDSLRHVCSKLLQYKITSVPIIHSSSPDESFPQLLHLASLAGILRCLCRHFEHSSSSLPILDQPIGQLLLGTWVTEVQEKNVPKLTVLKPEDSLDYAITLLITAEYSAIPIVDENGSLQDIYSRSDIFSLAKDQTYANIHSDDVTISKALKLMEEATLNSGQRYYTCLKSDSLRVVIWGFTNPGVRRIVVIEEHTGKVLGIISLSDIFHYLLGPTTKSQA